MKQTSITPPVPDSFPHRISLLVVELLGPDLVVL
jgi:hypothetical protein